MLSWEINQRFASSNLVFVAIKDKTTAGVKLDLYCGEEMNEKKADYMKLQACWLHVQDMTRAKITKTPPKKRRKMAPNISSDNKYM